VAPLVDIAGLRYHYPEAATPALDAVDLALEDGLCVVTGPSGGGKSTLLRLLNGLVPHLHGGRIAGRAHVAGHDVLRTPTRRMATTVGFVFQDAERQAVHATVERDIAFGLENIGCPAPEMHDRVDAILDRLAIGHLRERTIAGLSGGERQRVALAGALVLRPRLLVLDEPCSQLDAAGARALLEICLELRDAGTAIVLAEHRLDDVLPAANALVSVSGGRVRGPLAPRLLAADLDSAPQVVRLSLRLGVVPPLIDPSGISAQWLGDAGGDGAPATLGGARLADAWRLDAVTAGHGDLVREVSGSGGRGEVVALMGRNGSGKSTLLRLIAGLAPATAGDVWRTPGRVAYLPQNPAALLHRDSVAAEVAWTMRAEGRGAADEPGHAERLRILGVTGLLERDPRDLSSGERQRAAIAAILCGSPAIALLDEPTRGMDAAARAGLIVALRQLAAAGTSVVIATHDSELAAEAADRVLIIAGGEVRDRGAPRAALSGDHEHATQLGRLSGSPGPVTVDQVAERLLPRVTVGVAR
jgi:energy-coupling factor transporter ATP-binding protein EcfA2